MVQKVKSGLNFFKERQFILAILLAIFIAIFMTLASLKLYNTSYVSRLDVSLPDRENIRPEKTNSSGGNKVFQVVGPVDEKTLKEFDEIYTKNRKDLDVLGRFNAEALSDESLQLSEEDNQGE